MSESQQTPLTDLLWKIPKSRRLSWEEFHQDGSSAGYHLCPIGKMAHEAADELTRLQSEVDRLQGRVAELEDFVADAQKEAWRALDSDYVPPDVESAMKALLHKAAVITGEVDPDDIEPSPWLLRKHAEAVEPAIRTALRNLGNADITEEDISRFAEDYASRLRQQADELEKADEK